MRTRKDADVGVGALFAGARVQHHITSLLLLPVGQLMRQNDPIQKCKNYGAAITAK